MCFHRVSQVSRVTSPEVSSRAGVHRWGRQDKTGQVVWASSATDSLTLSHSQGTIDKVTASKDKLPGKQNTRQQPVRRWRGEPWKAVLRCRPHESRHRDIWRLPSVLTPPPWTFTVSSKGQAGWLSLPLPHSASIGSAIVMNYVFSGSNYPCQILYEIQTDYQMKVYLENLL